MRGIEIGIKDIEAYQLMGRHARPTFCTKKSRYDIFINAPSRIGTRNLIEIDIHIDKIRWLGPQVLREMVYGLPQKTVGDKILIHHQFGGGAWLVKRFRFRRQIKLGIIRKEQSPGLLLKDYNGLTSPFNTFQFLLEKPG